MSYLGHDLGTAALIDQLILRLIPYTHPCLPLSSMRHQSPAKSLPPESNTASRYDFATT